MEAVNREEGDLSRRVPPRMFAFGEEPVGVRVTPYHKPFAITDIIRALEEDEIDVLRRSPFGRLVEIAEKPTFSGRFGRYIISRQLKVRKKHEAWFVFAGKPIRFSLREFALVTGLNCGNYPPGMKRKAKRDINGRPYWGELFGTLKEVPVTTVVRMLKKRSVTSKETRIKYAFLALLASVVVPTTHTPRISHEYAEKIKDLDEFLAYPWGRVSFNLLMSSIKERNEVSLSQNTIALKGFVLALQLVMIEAVPALTEVVHEGGSSGSENEFSEEDEVGEDGRRGKRSISPGHARGKDIAGQACVMSIISGGNEDFNCEDEFGWSDEDEDDSVDTLVKLIEEGFQFTHATFTGGASRTDVVRMREETRSEAEVRKTTKQKSKVSASEVVDADSIAASVKCRLSDDFNRLSEEVKKLSGDISNVASDVKLLGVAFSSFQTSVVGNIQEMMMSYKEDILNSLSTRVNPSPATHTEDVSRQVDVNKSNDKTGGCKEPVSKENTIMSNIVDGSEVGNAATEVDVADVNHRNPNVINVHADVCEKPTSVDAAADKPESTVVVGGEIENPKFSLGLTQEEKGNESRDSDDVNEEICEEGVTRKSKRQKVVPKGLVGEYECDKKFLTRAWDSHVSVYRGVDASADGPRYRKVLEMLKTPFTLEINNVKIDSKELSVLVEKSSHLPPKIVDVLIHQLRGVYESASVQIGPNKAVFLDTKFVSLFSKTYGRFSKGGKKETFKFPPTLWECFKAACPTVEDCSRFYFPFNFDKTHWIGVCIDTTTWQLIVLDCNISKRTDAMLSKELAHIGVMFPVLLRQAGKQNCSLDLKSLAIERSRHVPQISQSVYAGVTSVLLIEAHAFGGDEVCKCINSTVVDGEIERLAVSIVESYHGIC